MQIDDAMSSFSYVGEMGPVDLAQGLAKIGLATVSFIHVDETRPAGLTHGPVKISDASSGLCHAGMLWPADLGHRPLGFDYATQHCFSRADLIPRTLDKDPRDHINFSRIFVRTCFKDRTKPTKVGGNFC